MQKRKNLSNKGQGLVEYLIIVAIMAVGTMAIMRALGGQLSSRFARITESLGGQIQGDIQNQQVSESMYKKRDLSNFFEGSEDKKRK